MNKGWLLSDAFSASDPVSLLVQPVDVMDYIKGLSTVEPAWDK